MRGALILLALATAGCSGPAPSAPTIPAGGASAVTTVPLGRVYGAGAPLVTPGERMTYRLSLKGLELAVLEFGVGDVQALGEKQAVLVQSAARTTGLAAMMSKVDDRFTSWIDVATGRSLRFQADELSPTDDTEYEHVTVDFTSRSGTSVAVMRKVNDGPETPEPQTLTAGDVWDFNSFLVGLRAWEPAGTGAITLQVMRSRWLWRIVARAAGTEKLVTELGELPTRKFSMTSTKLGRDGQRFPGNADRDFTIWVSDDDGRVPLLVTAATDYGDVKLEIVDYQPGAGTRLRP